MILIFIYLFADSVRAFKQKMKMGRFDEEAVKKKEEELECKEKNEEELAKAIEINNRFGI